MECYHEVGSVGHPVTGTLIAGDEQVDFGVEGQAISGRGYLEKDWGTSMPSAWVWIHGNGFPDPDDSVMISIARLDVDAARVGISVRSGPVTIEVNGTRTHTGMLAAPVDGAMDRRIAESLDSKLELIVTDGGRTVTETAGGSAGIELVGDVDSLRS